jgi:peroxiredoxin
MKRHEGDIVAPISLETIRGVRVDVPSPDAPFTHLQFRRFAGCPICNLHLRSVARRVAEITSAGIHEIAVFHSDAATMRPYQGDLPFDVVADPERKLYRAFGVEASLRSVVDPRAWGSFLRGAVASHASSSFTGEGGHLGLPADFFIAQNGRIVAVKYGVHADDQWSVEELLDLVQQWT